MFLMEISHSIEAPMAEQISAVREFNRFYTAKLGLLRRRHLDGEFSLTEARILYEIGTNPQMTASTLRGTLQLDAGYISRLLTALTRRKLVRQVASKVDGREKLLTLTAVGESAVARLDEQSTVQIREMLGTMKGADREALVVSLTKARSLLRSEQTSPIRIVRLTSVNEDALAILQEYYDAVHVVRRDGPGAIQKIVDAPGSGVWLAYKERDVVGCVVLRKLETIPSASECKRLYVRPSARGSRIADKLMDAQEEYARNQGIDSIYLDTYDDLRAAIALYERRGYERCERYNDNPQATLFMRKRIGARQASR